MNQAENLEEHDARPRGKLKLYRCERSLSCQAILFASQINGHECEILTVEVLASTRRSSDWNLPPAIRHRES